MRLNRFSLVTAWLFIAALTACNDATAPTETVTVSVSVAKVDGPSYGETIAHVPQVTCGIDLSAVATGRGTATWSGATLRFYIGPDHGMLLDTATFSGADIGRSWSEDGKIASGATQQTRWDMSAGIPFYVTFEYRYQSGKGEKKTSASFACGQPAAPNAPLPVIRTLTVTPPSGELPAGAPMTVSYTVDAPAGAWRTQVAISGPCDTAFTFNEKLETTLTRTFAVPIPGSCRLGAPITVTVYALDAIAQLGSRALSTGVVLTDHEAPSIFPLFWSPNGAPGVWTFHGDFFTGDSVRVELNASDNHQLSALIWEVLPFGARDSVLVGGLGAYQPIWIHFRPEWSGPFQLRFTARDAVGNVTTPLVTPLDSARLHPTAHYLTRTLKIRGEPSAFVVDWPRNIAYIGQGFNNPRILAVSLATMQVVNTIPLNGEPYDIDVTPSGDSLLLVIGGKLGLDVVNLRGATPVVTDYPLPWLDATNRQGPYNVRIGSNGRAYLTVRGATASVDRLVELNLADSSYRVLVGASLNGTTGLGILERSADRNVLALSSVEPSCLQRYDIAATAFSPCANIGYDQIRPSLDSTGSRVSARFTVFDASMQPFPRVHGDITYFPGAPSSMLSADGATLFIGTFEHGIVKVRSIDSEIIERIPIPVPGFMSASGTWLINVGTVFTSGETTVSLYDMSKQ